MALCQRCHCGRRGHDGRRRGYHHEWGQFLYCICGLSDGHDAHDPDQASKFSEYSAALPVTKEQLVGSKYIVGLCGLVLAELFAAAALGVASLHWTAVDHALVVSTLVQVGMTTLLNSAVLLPLNYRFGYEKAKYAFYFMVGLVAALMGFGVSANEDGLARNLLPQGVPPLALLGIVLIVLGLYSLSWRLSVAWYGKAEQ